MTEAVAPCEPQGCPASTCAGLVALGRRLCCWMLPCLCTGEFWMGLSPPFESVTWCWDEEELSAFIPTTPWRPPPEGTAQAQTGGVHGNDFLELILIQSRDRLCICIGVLGNFMHV